MREQNIYDDPSFFDGYQKLRQNPSAANDLVEKPALFSLLPDVAGKAVVDLGCGYGENCREFSPPWGGARGGDRYFGENAGGRRRGESTRQRPFSAHEHERSDAAGGPVRSGGQLPGRPLHRGFRHPVAANPPSSHPGGDLRFLAGAPVHHRAHAGAALDEGRRGADPSLQPGPITAGPAKGRPIGLSRES